MIILPSAFALLFLGISAHPSIAVFADGDIPTITDEMDNVGDGRVAADVYRMALQTGDVGFGTDSRVVSTYEATAAPTASTMWSDYGYVQYAVSGQNTLSVICDEAADLGAPLVWANTANQILSAATTLLSTSENGWYRRQYVYTIPDTTDWIRVLPVAFNSADGTTSFYWQQQITKIVIEEKTAEDPGEKEIDTIDDPFTASGHKGNDGWGIALKNDDVGFGDDYRYYSTMNVSVPATTETMWTGYAYLQYAVSGQNYATVVVDVDPKYVPYLPHPMLIVNRGGNVNETPEVNTYSIKTSTKYSRITYGYPINEDAQWVRVVFNSYDSWDGRILTQAPELTEVKFEKLEAIPAKSENIPTIEVIEKPKPEDVEVVDDPCDNMDSSTNTHIHDAYDITTTKFGEDGVFVTTGPASEEPTDTTWWESRYGYVEYNVDAQNLLTVQCYVSQYGLNHLPGVLAYAGLYPSLSKVALNNRIIGETVDGFINVTYQFVLPGVANTVRLIFPNYLAPDEKINRDSLKITNVRLEYTETLPTADPVDSSHNSQKEELDEYLGTLDKNAYSEGNWALITYYVLMGKYDLMLTSTEEAARSVIDGVKAQIQAVKTTAQELEDAKIEQKKRIEDYVASLSEDDYTPENWDRIRKLLRDAVTDIDAAADPEAAKQIADDTIADIQAVPVKEIPQPSSSEETPTSSEPISANSSTSSKGRSNKGKGCGGSVIGASGIGVASLFAALGLAVLARKKRK